MVNSSRALALLLTLLLLPPALYGQAPRPADDKKKEKDVDISVSSTIPTGQFTADELLNQGLTSYRAQRWEEAINAFGAFLRDFGAAQEAAGAVRRVKPLVAVSLAQLKRWDEALQSMEEVMQWEKEVDPGTLELIYFWRGMCHFFLDDYAKAREGLQAFAQKFPQSAKFTDAVIMHATSFMLEDDWAGAIDFCKIAIPNMKGTERSQLVVMLLHALVESERTDEAYDLVVKEFENLDDMVQLAAFQTLTLRLATLHMMKDEHYKAIGCVQRLWPLEEIEKKQKERLDFLKARQAALEKERGDPFMQHKLRLLIGKIEGENKIFNRQKNWNSSVGFRLASVYLRMGRYREAALVLDDLVKRLPADPVLEQAAEVLVKCWAQVGRWPEVVASADRFTEKFPKAPALAEVRFLKGIALQQDLKYEEARGVFLSVRDEFPEAKITPESDFQQAYCLVLTEDFPGAATEFERVYKEKKNPEMTALALYWQGNVLSMGKQFPKSKEVLQRYLKEFPKGESYTDAVYRVAYCTHSLGDYKASAAEMADYLKRFPQGLDRAEAQVLQGEAYLALGEVDKGIEILKAMPKTDPIMYAEAYFKVAKALKINKRDEELREHMARFEKEMPGSNRLAEALNWQGGSYRSEPEKAREIYLGAIRRLGNDSAQWSLTEVFRSLSKLYRGDKEAYVAQLRALRGEAQAGKRDTLLLYTYWAEADAVRKTAPERSQAALLEAAPFLKVQADNPEVMADIADALRVAGRTPEAETLYRDLRKWNPRAMQRDRAFMALAEMARDRGETEEARKWFARLEREVPNSPLVPGAQLALARMLSAEFRFKEAAAKLEPVLTRRGVQPRIKAQSMLLLADNSLSDNKVEAAIPYYEKIYLLYGRFAPEAAQAFLGHGKALEKQGKEKEAAGVYRDMLERAEVATLPAAQEARERMRKLPAPAPKEEVVNPS